MDCGLLAELVIGPANSGPDPLLGPGMTNRALTLPLQMFMVAREGRHDE